MGAETEAPVEVTARTRKPSARAAGTSGARGPSRPEPAERRRAARQVLAIWREVGRDLALATRRAGGRLRHLGILEELDEAASSVVPAELVAFLDRLDGWSAALEAYASPELVLDGALLSWPRARAAAA